MQDPDNPMLRPSAAELRHERQSREADKAAELLRGEFLDGLDDPLEHISTPGYCAAKQTQVLADAALDVLVYEPDAKLMADLLRALYRADTPEGLEVLARLADRHAENHVALLMEQGAFSNG